MPGISFDRLRWFVAIVLVVGLGSFGFAGMGFGAAVVGETRRVDLGQKAAAGLDDGDGRLSILRLMPLGVLSTPSP